MSLKNLELCIPVTFIFFLIVIEYEKLCLMNMIHPSCLLTVSYLCVIYLSHFSHFLWPPPTRTSFMRPSPAVMTLCGSHCNYLPESGGWEVFHWSKDEESGTLPHQAHTADGPSGRGGSHEPCPHL